VASQAFRAFRFRLLYRLLLGVTAVGRRIPLRSGRFLGRLLGRLAWHVARRERKKALANIALAFPEWTEGKRRATIRAMFRHMGMSLFEIAWLPNLVKERGEKTTLFEGAEEVMAQIDAGRGVVIFTAHCGNWEWLACGTGLWGRPTSVLQRERDQPEMNRYITDLRAHAGVHSIDRGSTSSARDMMRILRHGGILAFLVDQNLRTESVKVPFFGRPAPTPIGPAKLAIRTEALVSVTFTERLPDGRHVIRYLEPIQCKRGDDPVALVAHATRLIEEQIRRVPEQWVWMHDRWKERPKWDVTGVEEN
jgi:Kdo2-lipid IVA lauroyltransferase/acyltransferase